MSDRNQHDSVQKRKTAEPRCRRRHPVVNFILGVFSFIFGTLGFLFTMALIACITGLILVGIFMTYVNTSLKPDLYVDASEYVLKQSSIIYYMDQETGNWTELQKLHGEENRVIVDYKDIPKYLVDAAIAIEDKRFETHRGVDWRRTGGAVLELAKGDKSYGGSTITQQLLKNMTGDRETTIKRKVTEIFRALEFERRYTKEEIMEMYLNTITLGQGCYGVQTAAQLYFDKDVSELTLAESACIISITNNPSLYGPFSTVKVTNPETGVVKTARQMNKNRQETVLLEMLKQEKITQEEYDQAVAEELQFANVRTVEDLQEEAANEKKDDGSIGKQSWFVDEARREIVRDMVKQLGLTEKQATTKLLNGGYNIYLTLDPRIQELAESVYEDRGNLDVVSASGQQLRSGITIVDVTTGNVVAMVGDVGPKQGDMIFNYAMTTRQCGSSIKPLSVYAPALDAGVITMATVFDDYPVRNLNGSPWPKNSPTTYKGRTLLSRGVYDSVNTYAVQTMERLGMNNSYRFLTENMGLTTLVEEDGDHLGNLSLGGLIKGVNTMEMAAAYASFANDGVYNRPRMYVKVTDSQGKDVLVNDQETSVAMKQTTAHFMNKLLTTAVTSGTGKSAKFDGMPIGGKTGTTNDNYDRYFVGYTPYYSAAVWTGYDQNEKISYSGSPAIDMWRKVMEKVHAELERKEFHVPDGGLMSVKICRDSGMLAGQNCTHDLRGDRTTTVEVAIGTQPQEVCTMHVMREYCTAGKCLKFPGCTEDCVVSVALLDFDRPEYYTNGVYDPATGTISAPTKKNSAGEIVEMPLNIVAATDDAYVLSRLDDTKECPVHGLGEGWAYDEEGNLVYTPPVVEPELPDWFPPEGGEWLPDSGELFPGGSNFEDWWNSIFGGGDDPENPGTEQPGTEPVIPQEPGTEPEQPTEPTPPAEPSVPADPSAAGGWLPIGGLLDLFT